MNGKDKPSAPTIEAVKKQWENLGEDYSHMDSAPQTYYYTLSNMLKLQSAQKILEVACGVGKLLPLTMDLKNPNAEYFATDISQKMLQLFRNRLEHHFQKYESKLTLEEWMNKMKLKVRLMNGEEDLASQLPQQNAQELRKFDRIIANLVIMLTSDGEKMLKNLFDHAQKGCLLGLTVWGNKQENNFQTMMPELIKQYGFPSGPNTRSNFYLYKKVEQIANKAGWSLVLNWEQKSIFPFSAPEELRTFANHVIGRMAHLTLEQKQQLQEGYIKKASDIFASKKPMQFSCQVYIFRKN